MLRFRAVQKPGEGGQVAGAVSRRPGRLANVAARGAHGRAVGDDEGTVAVVFERIEVAVVSHEPRPCSTPSTWGRSG